MKRHIGDVVGRLTIVEILPRRRADVVCACGNTATVSLTNLGRATFSCGCLMRERTSAAARRHGLTGTPEHNAWIAAKGRCFNPRNDAYARYGGRGITMCAEWLDSFEAFLRDMGQRPSRHSLDRYPDCNGPYAPGNCRWASAREQSNNRRSNRLVTWNGVTKTVAEWAVHVGIPNDILKQRINKLGWSAERALSTRPRGMREAVA